MNRWKEIALVMTLLLAFRCVDSPASAHQRLHADQPAGSWVLASESLVLPLAAHRQSPLASQAGELR